MQLAINLIFSILMTGIAGVSVFDLLRDISEARNGDSEPMIHWVLGAIFPVALFILAWSVPAVMMAIGG